MRVLWILPCVVALGGCGPSRDELHQIQMEAAQYEAKQQCNQSTLSSEQKTDCYNAVVSARMAQLATERARNQEASAQASRAMITTGLAGIAAQPPPPRPVNCTSRPWGDAVQTTCQ